MAAIVDFGINTQEHYEALYDPIRSREISLEQLDAVLGDGPALTKLVNSCKSNRHKGIVFTTAWDNLEEE